MTSFEPIPFKPVPPLTITGEDEFVRFDDDTILTSGLGVYVVKEYRTDTVQVKGTVRSYAVLEAILEGESGKLLKVQWTATDWTALGIKLADLHGSKNPDVGQAVELLMVKLHGSSQPKLRPTTVAEHLVKIAEREGL